ncbi:MAG TPA: efflux RND transporter periplasmic adaptor subunit [Gemmatimonadaceae bacterium]|jgi:HlyD family secretion protein|nr:efflux RND transporter periplasmic adaptor subunit [Gemmatimonadaceae bacterium]
MRPPTRLLRIALPVAVLLALGAASYLKIRDGAAAPSGDDAARPIAANETEGAARAAGDVAIPVEGAAVVRGTLVVSVTATGQAAPQRQTRLLALVAGRLAQVPARESQRLTAGALVAAVDPAEFELAVAEARARYESAEATYQELTLFDDRMADSAQRAERARIARARSGLEGAEVAVKRAELDLRRARVTAPFDGDAADVRVVPGQHVRVGDELATVMDLDPIKIEVQVLESEVGFLAAGRTAQVTLAAFPGQTFAGRIESINPVVETGTRTARVTVIVPNAQRRILPGMYARVSLEAQRFPDRVLVPRAAVLERDRRTMLFVYDGDQQGGLAKWRYVTTGLGNADEVEVVEHPDTDMVQPGERVLVDGHYTLTHDARVRLVPSVKESGGRPR